MRTLALYASDCTFFFPRVHKSCVTRWYISPRFTMWSECGENLRVFSRYPVNSNQYVIIKFSFSNFIAIREHTHEDAHKSKGNRNSPGNISMLRCYKQATRHTEKMNTGTRIETQNIFRQRAVGSCCLFKED